MLVPNLILLPGWLSPVYRSDFYKVNVTDRINAKKVLDIPGEIKVLFFPLENGDHRFQEVRLLFQRGELCSF